MGAHGVSPFDDDEASDFAAEILAAKDIQILADALFAVPDDDSQYVEHGTAVRALVAAELIAAQIGRESGDVPDELQDWVDDQGDPDAVLERRAIRAVKRVQRDSETCELWKASPQFRDWRDRTEDLLRRLT